MQGAPKRMHSERKSSESNLILSQAEEIPGGTHQGIPPFASLSQASDPWWPLDFLPVFCLRRRRLLLLPPRLAPSTDWPLATVTHGRKSAATHCMWPNICINCQPRAHCPLPMARFSIFDFSHWFWPFFSVRRWLCSCFSSFPLYFLFLSAERAFQLPFLAGHVVYVFID